MALGRWEAKHCKHPVLANSSWSCKDSRQFWAPAYPVNICATYHFTRGPASFKASSKPTESLWKTPVSALAFRQTLVGASPRYRPLLTSSHAVQVAMTCTLTLWVEDCAIVAGLSSIA